MVLDDSVLLQSKSFLSQKKLPNIISLDADNLSGQLRDSKIICP